MRIHARPPALEFPDRTAGFLVAVLLLFGCSDLPGGPDPCRGVSASGCDPGSTVAAGDTFPVPLIDGDGLYGNGSNAMPAFHRQAGLAVAATLPDSGVVFGPLGQSVTGEMWHGMRMQLATGETDAALVPTGCGGCTTEDWDQPGDEGWVTSNRRLRDSGYAPADMQVVWMEVTGSQTTPPTVEDLEDILAAMAVEWPNVKQLWVSSRFYGGYRVKGDGEPAAWEAGPAVREFVLNHLGETDPWIAWGPYTWANGAEPNGAGLAWHREDFRDDDGLHLSRFEGWKKAGELLRRFMTSGDPLVAWFVGDPSASETRSLPPRLDSSPGGNARWSHRADSNR